MPKLKYAGEINAGTALTGASLNVSGHSTLATLSVTGATNLAAVNASVGVFAATGVSQLTVHAPSGNANSSLNTDSVGAAARHQYSRAGSAVWFAGLGAWTGGNNYEIAHATAGVISAFTAAGVIAHGTAQTAGASVGDNVYPNLRGPRGVNVAGTTTLPLVSVDSFNQTALWLNGERMRLDNAALVNSAGAAGGAGALPATPVTYVKVTIPGVVNGIIPVYNEP